MKKMRKPVGMILLLLVCAMALPSCSSGKNHRKSDLPADLIGNPYLESKNQERGIFPNGLKDRWTEEIWIMSGYDNNTVPKDTDIYVYCRFFDKYCEELDLGNQEKSLLTMYVFKQNDDYEWNKKEALEASKGNYFEGGFPNLETGWTDGSGYGFPVTIKTTSEYGKYTLVFVREDDTVDAMVDFEVVKKDQLDKYETTAAKPVIYLYPEKETDVTVRLELDGYLTCTYPEYGEGWNVIAFPDGRIYDKASERYYDYLFWEGRISVDGDVFAHSACVAAEDSAAFLEEYLAASGLNDSEIDDFISYWLPKLQASPYNLIAFPISEYCERVTLDVAPAPDTEIRVYMVFTPLDEAVEIPKEQALTVPDAGAGVERRGYTVVEWGGTELGV